METFLSKHKWLVWLVVALMIINITALVTIAVKGPLISFRQRMEMPPCPKPDGLKPPEMMLMGRLNLSPEQEEKTSKIRQLYFEEVRHIHRSIMITEDALFEELAKENPDTVNLAILAKKSGMLFEQLKTNTCNYFLLLKEQVDPHQQKIINNFLNQTIMERHRCMMNQRAHYRYFKRNNKILNN